MADPYATVPVSVALIRDPSDNILWVWDDEWGCFALPTTRPKVGTSDMERPADAARRAAAKALGVPVRVGQHVRLEPELHVSGRDLTMRRYRYDVFRADPHPDFAARVAPPAPHLWLAPHRALSGEYEPLSATCRWVVAGLVSDGYLPGRSQYTAVLVVRREHHGKKQFLLRREPGWGYALPTKRRANGESYAAAAERVAREELGVSGAALGLTPASEAVVTSRDLSRAEQTPTFYCHGVFEAVAPAATAFATTGDLVWADAKTILGGEVDDHLTADGRKAPAGRVSPTALHILQELDHVPAVDRSVVRA